VNYYNRVFKTGLYTYLKPADREDLDLFPYTYYDSKSACIATCSFPLFRSSLPFVFLRTHMARAHLPCTPA